MSTNIITPNKYEVKILSAEEKIVSIELGIFESLQNDIMNCSNIIQKNAKVLAKHFLSVKQFFKTCKKLKVNNQSYLNEFLSINGIGKSQVDSLKKFFSNKQNLMVISNLINLLDVKNYKLLVKKSPLSG